jgi:hypothetical protein
MGAIYTAGRGAGSPDSDMECLAGFAVTGDGDRRSHRRTHSEVAFIVMLGGLGLPGKDLIKAGVSIPQLMKRAAQPYTGRTLAGSPW